MTIQEKIKAHQKRLKTEIKHRKDSEKAVFDGVDFKGISFKGVDLREVTFINCDLSGVNFSHCKMQHVEFYSCDLRGCSFSYSNLKFSKITNCKAAGADFSHSNFSWAKIYSCNFVWANFEGSILEITSIRFCEFDEAKGVFKWTFNDQSKANYSVYHLEDVYHNIDGSWGTTKDYEQGVSVSIAPMFDKKSFLPILKCYDEMIKRVNKKV
jgi:uncharacterized protein YjbI with pentapeptide repeats